jgi:hypothetical protein
MVIAEFRAPWCRALRHTTVLTSLLLLSMVALGFLSGPHELLLWWLAMVGVPIVVLVSSALFTVLGYAVTETTIEVKRLCWTTSLPLQGLRAVSGDEDAMRGSLRLFGNGGLFAITGWLWSRKLGRYRAFATDPARAVILRYANRKILLTPDDVQKFIVLLRKQLSGSAA